MSKDTISIKPSKKTESEIPSSPGATGLRSQLHQLLSFIARTWEVYVILLVAAFLRFYQISTTELDEDQARLYQMAYDAVHHGLLPTTSNAASIGIANPPGVIYFFMPLAALSANPLWGAALVGIFTTATSLLTYFFTRRYYGRFAGIIAALLYATAARPLNYARFIWQPNLMPPFVVLFMFALFWGVVERRKGWLLPALFLLGVLYQMHPTTLLLAIPLLVALALAHGTLRWRDLALAVVSLLIIFSPYLIWQAYTRFADIHTVLSLAKQHAHIDTQAIHFYRIFLSPYDKLPTDAHSVVLMLAPLLSWLTIVVPLLTLGGLAIAGMLLLQSGNETNTVISSEQSVARISRATARVAPTIDEKAIPVPQGTTAEESRSTVGAGLAPALSPLTRALVWWSRLRSSPHRCGLLVLLTWQIVPLLLLSRHAIDLHAQYFFMFMPGPFILIGLSLTKAVQWLQESERRWSSLRYGVYILAVLVIFTQLVGSTAAVTDTSYGNFDDRSFQPYPYHNDLRSLQHALDEADQLAQQHHLNRVYITTDYATQTALRYLAEQIHTPTTLFDASTCLVLPNPADGPAVLLVGPYDSLSNALLGQFTTAMLVDQPTRLGGPPFRLYIVTPIATSSPSPNIFKGNLQLLDTSAHHLNYNGSTELVTRWNLLHPEQPSYRTTYSYALTAISGSGQSMHSLCTFTSTRAGDQMLVAFGPSKGSLVSTSITIKAQSFMTVPYNPFYGPFHLETDNDQNTVRTTLETGNGKDSLTIPG